jgi:hypothetical protein
MSAVSATEAAISPRPERPVRSQLAPPTYLPPPPRTLDDLGVPEHLLMDLALRHINARGLVTIHLLAHIMKLPLELAELLFRHLSEQHYLEVRRMSGDDYVFSLSPAGRKLAAERAFASRYAGPIPVSLKDWTAAVRAQVARIDVTREKLRAAFHDIIIEDKLLDMLGPALISQSAMFLYGPSGTGKSTVAERLMRVFNDAVVVPWAIEVEGQIIIVGDTAVHQRVDCPDIDTSRDLDPRWMVCRRPFIAVGGELVTSMLDLARDDVNGCFMAPLQMKANNGILLIDDFGRQMSSPRDLLNRWIVPLDRRVDFLTLGNGAKFDIPFELQIVFSTNLAPQELADEAFLRRIPNKILLEAIAPEPFDQIFRLTAAAAGLTLEPGSEQLLRELCLRHSPDLRPCFPRDICNAIRAIALYEHRPPVVTRLDLHRAVSGYFV